MNATVKYEQAEEKEQAIRTINNICWQIKANQKILNEEGVPFREATIERYRIIKNGQSEFKAVAGEVIDGMRNLNEQLESFREKFGGNSNFASTEIVVGVRVVSEQINEALNKMFGTVLFRNDENDQNVQEDDNEEEDAPVEVQLAKVANWLANHRDDVWIKEEEKQSMSYAEAFVSWMRFAVQTLRNKGRTVQAQDAAAGNVCQVVLGVARNTRRWHEDVNVDKETLVAATKWIQTKDASFCIHKYQTKTQVDQRIVIKETLAQLWKRGETWNAIENQLKKFQSTGDDLVAYGFSDQATRSTRSLFVELDLVNVNRYFEKWTQVTNSEEHMETQERLKADDNHKDKWGRQKGVVFQHDKRVAAGEYTRSNWVDIITNNTAQLQTMVFELDQNSDKAKEFVLVVTTRRFTFYQKFSVNIAFAARAEQVDETILNALKIFDVAGPEQAITSTGLKRTRTIASASLEAHALASSATAPMDRNR